MKICVVGAGAIGGILAYRLAAAGNEVSIIARGAHLTALQGKGLTLVDHLENGKTANVAVVAEEDPGELARRSGVPELVILGLKAHAIGPMLSRIAPLIGEETVVVPAINGVPWWYFHREGGPHEGKVVHALDPTATMFADLDCAHVLGCVVHAAGEVRAPGVVHQTGGRRFILGEIDRHLDDPITSRLSNLCATLAASGFDAHASRDIRVDVWTKLIGNLSFNPVAALTNSLMNQLCSNEELLQIIRSILVEGMAVAAGYGVRIAMTPDERIALARQLGAAKISMHQDFEALRVPEIDAIVGAVIELAELVQVEVPVVQMVAALTRARARNLGIYVYP